MSAEVTEWIPPVGSTLTLDVDWDVSGRFMSPIFHEEDLVPGQPGGRHRSAIHRPKDFTLKVTLVTDTEPELRTAQREIVKSMDPTKGEGIIRVTSTLGDVREVPCYYVDGLGMEEKSGSSGPTMQQAVITFRSYDPYWRDTSDIVQTFTVGAPPMFFPFFPLRLAASEIAFDGTVDNSGDVETWPVWTIDGPGSGIILRNLTTGENIVLSTLVLGIGESLTIDTRPGRKTVLLQDGTNKFADLAATSVLWSLTDGPNLIRLEMSGTDLNSSLQLNYRRKYLSP